MLRCGNQGRQDFIFVIKITASILKPVDQRDWITVLRDTWGAGLQFSERDEEIMPPDGGLELRAKRGPVGGQATPAFRPGVLRLLMARSGRRAPLGVDMKRSK